MIDGTAQERTSKSGKPFTTAKLKAATNEGELVFINVLTFNADAQAALLAQGVGPGGDARAVEAAEPVEATHGPTAGAPPVLRVPGATGGHPDPRGWRAADRIRTARAAQARAMAKSSRVAPGSIRRPGDDVRTVDRETAHDLAAWDG